MKHGKSLLCLLLALLLLTGCAPADTQQTAEPQAAANRRTRKFNG